jgi:hypothetical protein
MRTPLGGAGGVDHQKVPYFYNFLFSQKVDKTSQKGKNSNFYKSNPKILQGISFRGKKINKQVLKEHVGFDCFLRDWWYDFYSLHNPPLRGYPCLFGAE